MILKFFFSKIAFSHGTFRSVKSKVEKAIFLIVTRRFPLLVTFAAKPPHVASRCWLRTPCSEAPQLMPPHRRPSLWRCGASSSTIWSRGSCAPAPACVPPGVSWSKASIRAHGIVISAAGKCPPHRWRRISQERGRVASTRVLGCGVWQKHAHPVTCGYFSRAPGRSR